MSAWPRVLRYAWAAPATLIGLLAGALCLGLGGHVRRVEGTLEFGGGALGRFVRGLPERMRFGAITLGHAIVGLDGETLEHCRAHERVHVRQYERWGVLFFPLYAASSIAQWARGRDPYRDNRFEREAYGCESGPGNRETMEGHSPEDADDGKGKGRSL
ncbi:MAG TPA: hypothetical protein VFK48_18720 [Usitatibacter sp.]|nr:hypothetical protein [Usitatibacter sp.]